MTTIYETPARPWAFGSLIGTDIVTRQAEALVQRYDLLDALAAGGEARRDLDPLSKVDLRLREVIARQLVPWVDYDPKQTGPDGDCAPLAAEGWPVPQGVRLEALCYSPWLDALRAPDGTIDGKRVFALPGSAGEFADQFYVRSGIVSGTDTISIRSIDAAFQDSFRFTPLVVGEVAMDLRRSMRSDRPFRLLMSRHFEEACGEEPLLLAPHPLLQACGFDDMAVVAFERLAELARSGMIVREVGRHADASKKLFKLLKRANAPEFIAANATAPGIAYSAELARALANDPELLTLCEYLAVGTDVLASWRNAVVADRGTFHEGFRPAAVLAGGSIASDTATALAWMVDVRTAFLSAFRTPVVAGPGSRQSALDNDILFRWFGLTNLNSNLAAALMAEFNAVRPDGRARTGTPKKIIDDDVRNAIALIVARLGRDGRNAKISANGVREGSWLDKVFLPERGQAGSAARADDSLWRERYRDQPFWARLQQPDRGWIAGLQMRTHDQNALIKALIDMRSLAGGLSPWAPSPLTARLMADLSTGISALSVNPAFARSAKRLVRLNRLVVQAQTAWNRLPPGRRRRIEQMQKLGCGHTLGSREIPDIQGLSARYSKSSRKRPRH